MTGTKRKARTIRIYRTAAFLALSIFAVLSCNFSDNSDDSKRSGEQEKYVTVCGTFSLYGAVPSSLRSDTGTRSAFPSLPEVISYSVTAEKSDGTTANPTLIDNDTGNFEIKLTPGEWTLDGKILNASNIILSGSITIEITDSSPSKTDIEIIVKPDSSTGSGTVNLPVSVAETSGITSATVTWQGQGTSTATTNTQTLDFSSSTSAYFTMGGTSVSSGAYTAVFQFYSEESGGTKRLLYQCTETINVCANLCTDCWVKNGTTSSAWLTETDGKTTFTVTEELIEKFALTSFFVQGTAGTYTPKTNADDVNNGTYFDPLATVQAAVDKIIQINDGETEYSIFIDGTVTAPDAFNSSATPNFITIEPGKKLNLTIASVSSSQAKINANKKAGVMNVIGYSETDQTTLTLQNVCITGGNTTDDAGGGIKAQYAGITLKSGTVIGTKLLPEDEISSIATSSIYANHAKGGGGIYLNGCILTIEDGVYICQNYSETTGGGIYAEGNSKIIATGGIIAFNLAPSGGGIYIDGGSAELTASTITLNSATVNGGGIYATNAELTLNEGTVIGKKMNPETDDISDVATTSDYSNKASDGGGIYIENTNLTIEDGVYICHNTTSNPSSNNYGGGIHAEKSSTITIKGGVIGWNYARLGGAIWIAGEENSTDILTIANTKICYNKTSKDEYQGDGSALFLQNCASQISDSQIFGNYTATHATNAGPDTGGAIILWDGNEKLTLNKVECYNNKSDNNGGVLAQSGTQTNADVTITATDCTFENNTASANGGVFFIKKGSLTLENCTVNENSSGLDGGGVYIYNQATFTMTGGSISGNKHGDSGKGNGIYVGSDTEKSQYGTLNLSGNAYIAPDNDVYLAEGTYVTVTGELTETSLPVATLTPNTYSDNRKMLNNSSDYTLQKNDCDKFAVTKDSVNEKFYRVSFEESSTTGILKEAKLTPKPELSNIKLIPTIKAIDISNVQAGNQKISFTVQKKTIDSAGTGTTYTKVTPTNAKIELYQNGSQIQSHYAETTNSTPEFKLQSWLPEGTYNLYMTATVDGIEYSAWEAFIIARSNPISSFSSAPNAQNYPFLSAETGEDFKKLDEWMQNGSTMEGITITLTDNIDLTAETEWQPIGYTGDLDANFSENNGTSFKGTLDGNGKSIQFEINSSTQKMIGLFLRNEGTIENLVIEQYTKDETQIGSSSSNVSRGGAFCVINNGTIRNCINKANFKVYTFWDVGGICMLNYGTIENCLNTGNIEMTNDASAWNGGYQKSGGIAGQNAGNIYNCVNTGTISTYAIIDTSSIQANLSGTISSMLIDNAQIKNCYWLKNCLSRNGSQSNQVVYFNSSGTSYVNSFPDTATVEGCGYFESFTATAPLTAGDEDSCKSSQTLSYGTTLIDALNGYVSANTDKELKQWQTAEDGTITLAF